MQGETDRNSNGDVRRRARAVVHVQSVSQLGGGKSWKTNLVGPPPVLLERPVRELGQRCERLASPSLGTQVRERHHTQFRSNGVS